MNTVLLRDLPRLVEELAALVQRSDFKPDLIVYVETGARLVAWELCARLELRGVPVHVKRPGGALKSYLVPFLRRLPRAVTAFLRRFEERSGVHKATGRTVRFTVPIQSGKCRVLLVDDAADTGQTVRYVRRALDDVGIRQEDIRTAVLTATTEEARAEVDYWVLDRNVCLPWSSDSPERDAALAEFEKKIPPLP